MGDPIPEPDRWVAIAVSIPAAPAGQPGRGRHSVAVAEHETGDPAGPGRWSATDDDGDRWLFEEREHRRGYRTTDSAGRAIIGPRTLAGAIALAERAGARFSSSLSTVVP